MSFVNSQGFHISGGQFNHVEGDQYQSVDPILTLWQAIKDVGASHNSAARYPPPKCHPDTREAVLSVIHDWIDSESPENRIFWLYGPAGAGKSAIAQSIAEKTQQKGYLASSFFFSRSDTKRNTAKSLLLTVVYGFVTSIPELREPIGQAIQSDPSVLEASLDEQFQKLIVEPFRTVRQLQCQHPWLIIVDGLDECSGSQSPSQEQRRILIIAAAMATVMKCIRLRFLVCSRPESAIRETFNTNLFRRFLCRVALDDTFEPSRDIAIFLNTEFERIRTSPLNHHIQFPVPWPAPGVMWEVVRKASGQFVYAATVVKYIDNEYANPCEQLEIILRPRSRSDLESGSPFSSLDVLYHQILSSNPQRSRLREILRTLEAFKRVGRDTAAIPTTPQFIEAMLVLSKGDVMTALRGMHSVLNIGGPDKSIRILHASFSDFLNNAERSDYFFIGDQDEYLAGWLLRASSHYPQVCGGDEYILSFEQRRVLYVAWINWAHHCSRTKFNNTVLEALLNVNFTQSLCTYINNYLATQNTGFLGRIQEFLSQTCLLLFNLPMDSDLHSDVARHFSDFMRGFRVRVSQPGKLDTAELHGILDETARRLTGRYVLRREDDMWDKNWGKLSNFWKNHCQAIFIGNDCGHGCTRAKGTSSYLSLPCSESTSGDVYHIQLDDLEKFSDGLNIFLQFGAPSRYRGLWSLLEICGPFPELLDLLPLFLSKIKHRDDQKYGLRWLQSFPSEYTLRTSPLIQQIKEIRCEM